MSIYEFESAFVVAISLLAGGGTRLRRCAERRPVSGRGPTIDSAGAFLYAAVPMLRLWRGARDACVQIDTDN